MNRVDFIQAIQAQLEAEAANPESRIWLSFADEDGCRGVAIVLARGVIDALRKAHELGIRPGGEVMPFVLPDDDPIDPKYLNRLIPPDEIVSSGLGGPAPRP